MSRPVEPEEPPLGPEDIARYRQLLIEARASVQERLRARVDDAVSDERAPADEMDLASRDQEAAVALRIADKERKLLREIDHALTKIDDGTFGICEGTDEPIGRRRLDARPWARYTIAYKELLERESRERG